MREVILRNFGSVECFEEAVTGRPDPKADEVRVRIEAASFNPIDALWRNGRISPSLPVILGRDFSGTVDAVGSDVKDFAVGDEVFGIHGGLASNGSYAEYLCVHQRLVACKPRTLSHAVSAGVPIVTLTAMKCVWEKAHVEGGSAFITGASGAVGSTIIQLCRLSGARAVGTTGSDAGLDVLRKLGIGDEAAIDYRGAGAGDLAERARAAIGGGEFEYTFDTAGGRLKELCFELAATDGHVVSIVEEPADYALNLWDERTSPMVAKSLSFHFEQLSARAAGGDPEKLVLFRQYLERAADLLDTGQLQPLATTIVGPLGLGTVQRAHQLLDDRKTSGKLVMARESIS